MPVSVICRPWVGVWLGWLSQTRLLWMVRRYVAAARVMPALVAGEAGISYRAPGGGLSRVERSVEFLDRELADHRPEALRWWAERSLSDRELDWQRADLRALHEMSDSERAWVVVGLIEASRDLRRWYGEAFQAATTR
ncbi:hypothetical protein [Micromonospora sp. NPDC005707]|uniref:hypothetical protein n=1 Tax=Micromonospora sp. NPDC005707 TaxID=3157050 RepID=UPI0033FD40D8